MSPANYDGVALCCPVTVPYRRYSERTAAFHIGECLRSIVASSGVAKGEIDGLCISSFTLPPDNAVFLLEHFDMSVRWIEQVPFGGASGILSLRRAARAIQAGDATVIACIAGDTNRPGEFRELVANFSSFTTTSAYPYGAGGPNAVFALIARAFMQAHGLERRHLGRLAVAQRHNAGHFPHALLRQPISIDDYLSSRIIAEPLHLLDCVMACAGAEGFLVTSVDFARRSDLPFVEVAAAAELHNAFQADAVQTRGGWRLLRDGLYDIAGIGPEDIDFVQTYDDYPVMSAMQLRDLGLLDEADLAGALEAADFSCDGSLPHNTSGGQLSVGQAGAAGGYLGLVEALRQLTDAPLGLAVREARHGLVSGYGMTNYDRGVCSAAAILRRPSA